MAMVGIIFMSFINDCVLYLVSCSFWILKTKVPWMYIRGQDKLDEKSATKIHMYVPRKDIYSWNEKFWLHSRALGTCKTYIYLHTNRDSIFAESDPQRGKIVSEGEFSWTLPFFKVIMKYFVNKNGWKATLIRAGFGNDGLVFSCGQKAFKL